MTKTAHQIEGDFYHMLKGSPLADALTGSVYRQGTRPRDSRLEDAVVIFTEGTPTEIERGTVTVNIYVPDLNPYPGGQTVEDTTRAELLEAMAQQWADSLTADRSRYLIALARTIRTDYDAEDRQHFVVVRLNYRLFNP